MRGTIRDIIPSFHSFILSLQVDSVDESLMGKDLSIEIKPYKKKRSLNANSYFHVLCTRLAEANETSINEMKNLLIADYGQFKFTDDGTEIQTLYLRADVDYLKLKEPHLVPTGQEMVDGGVLYYKYYIMRGSHTYDSAEMSRLIRGASNECKEVGIQTLDDIEMERIIARWESSGMKKPAIDAESL